MKKTGFIFLFACLFCVVGCTKTKSNATDLYNPVAMPQLTEANYVDTLLKEIKHYPQELLNQVEKKLKKSLDFNISIATVLPII